MREIRGGHVRELPEDTRRGTHAMIIRPGVAMLGDIADRLPMLDVACSKRDRRGRLSVAKLITQHGADMRLPDLREILAGDYPRARSSSVVDRCGVHYPQLLELS
jgi:hypothetical protein